jgi:hypothetical protein
MKCIEEMNFAYLQQKKKNKNDFLFLKDEIFSYIRTMFLFGNSIQ